MKFKSFFPFLMITPRILPSERSSSSNDVMISPKHSEVDFSMRRKQRGGTNAEKY